MKKMKFHGVDLVPLYIKILIWSTYLSIYNNPDAGGFLKFCGYVQ